jgi:hypothetical protein
MHVMAARDPLDAWFFARPEELGLMRHTLQQWLTECAVDPNAATELVAATHGAAVQCLGQLSPTPGDHGFALRGEYDGNRVAVTLIAPNDVRSPALADGTRWSTQVVLQLVDEAEVEARDDATQVSLRRDTR